MTIYSLIPVAVTEGTVEWQSLATSPRATMRSPRDRWGGEQTVTVSVTPDGAWKLQDATKRRRRTYRRDDSTISLFCEFTDEYGLPSSITVAPAEVVVPAQVAQRSARYVTWWDARDRVLRESIVAGNDGGQTVPVRGEPTYNNPDPVVSVPLTQVVRWSATPWLEAHTRELRQGS